MHRESTCSVIDGARNAGRGSSKHDSVRDAAIGEVEETIAAVTWPEQKAPRIQQVLREITRLRSELSLKFLANSSVPEARAWLEALPGIGLRRARRRCCSADSECRRYPWTAIIIGWHNASS